MSSFPLPEVVTVQPKNPGVSVGLAFLVVALAFYSPSSASAASGTWNVNADGSWSGTGNWVGGTIADGVGFTADFTTVNITSNRIVDIDTTSRTLGAFLIGDTTLNQNYTITSTTGKTLTFNNSGTGATLTSSNGGTPTFSVPIILADNLTITKAGSGLVISGGISGTGNLIIKNNSSGNMSLSNNVTLIDNVGSLTNSGSNGNVNIAAKLGPNLTSVIQNSASSTMTLSSASGGFAGSVSALNGTIVFSSQTGLDSSNMVSVSAGGTFQVGSNSALTIAGLNGSGGTVQGSSSSVARSLVLGGSGTYSYSGSITDNNTGGGGITNITKSGVSIQTLGGINSYTGTTTISAGTLLIDGNQSTASGAVSVASGATLGGIGTLGGATLVNGILAPGTTGIGTLNIANDVTWNGPGVGGADTDWKFELGAGNTADLLNLTGANSDFFKGTGSVFRFDFVASTSTGTFKLVDWADTATTTFLASNFSYTNLGGGNVGTFEISGSQLNFVIVPEPSVIGLLMAGLFPMWCKRRRRSS